MKDLDIDIVQVYTDRLVEGSSKLEDIDESIRSQVSIRLEKDIAEVKDLLAAQYNARDQFNEIHKFIFIMPEFMRSYLDYVCTVRRVPKAVIVRNAILDIMERDLEWKQSQVQQA